MAGDEVSSGSSVSIGDPQMRALLEALSRGQFVVKPTIGLSEAQRFNGSSYSTWRLKFSRRAEEVDLWPYYSPDKETGEGVPPTETETAEKIAEFRRKSKQAFFQLCHSVSDGIAVNLDPFKREVNSAEKAWACLESMYLRPSNANKSAVRKKLLLLSMREDEKIIDYVNRARSLNDELAAMGDAENEEQMIEHTASGLPETWATEKSGLVLHPPESMTQLVDKLQSIEAMKIASKGKTEAAYGGQEKPGMVNAAAAWRISGACYHCGKKGHKAIDCYDNPKSRNYKGKEAASDGEGWQQRKGFGGTCDFCGRYGYRAADCYSNPNSKSYRGPAHQQRNAPKANVMEAEKEKGDIILGGAHRANIARVSNLQVDGFKLHGWYFDSGCTQHMTNRSDWLENVRESSEKFILLGDSTKLPVTGEGDVLLCSRFGELKLKGVLLVKDLSMNLISQSQMDALGCKVLNDQGKVTVFGPTWEVVADGKLKRGFYEMDFMPKLLVTDGYEEDNISNEAVVVREETGAEAAKKQDAGDLATSTMMANRVEAKVGETGWEEKQKQAAAETRKEEIEQSEEPEGKKQTVTTINWFGKILEVSKEGWIVRASDELFCDCEGILEWAREIGDSTEGEEYSKEKKQTNPHLRVQSYPFKPGKQKQKAKQLQGSMELT
ncbi:hypothetical protein CLOP_g13714 [Closterium sp. NIES-67]|nr:hypothetical protein CLOP_g13714 [Closterium sp. NIES-67]